MGRLSTLKAKSIFVSSPVQFETVNPFQALMEEQDRGGSTEMGEMSADPRRKGEEAGRQDGSGDDMVSLVEGSNCFEVARHEEESEEVGMKYHDEQFPVFSFNNFRVHE